MHFNISNNPSAALAAFSDSRVIVPAVDFAIGSWPNEVLQVRYANRTNVLGSHLAERAPFSYCGFDSADYAKRTKLRPAADASLTSGGPPVHVYEATSITALIAALDSDPATRPIARKLEKIPKEAHSVSSIAGLMSEPSNGVANLYGSYSRIYDSIKPALLGTRDSERIKECEQAGYRVLLTNEIVANFFANSASGTGSQAIIKGRVMFGHVANMLGLKLRARLHALMSSPNDSTDPNRSLENTGAFLTAVAIGQTQPESISVTPIGDHAYSLSEPHWDEIYLIGCASPTGAASTRRSITERLGVQACVESFTQLLPTVASSFVDGIAKHARSSYGASIAWGAGAGRLYYDASASRALATSAAARFIAENL